MFIAIGGWDAGGAIFSNMVGSATNRAAFIQSVIQFCATHGFDGVDIDWECKWEPYMMIRYVLPLTKI